MYVRKKTVKGRDYYQIVTGVRDGERVQQRIVLALGTTPDPRAALKGMERELARLRRERDRHTPREGMSRTTARTIERLDARIAKLQRNVFKLGALIKSKLIGTTEKVRGTMEEITAECGARGLAIITRPGTTKRKGK
jgi:hypothetical protein